MPATTEVAFETVRTRKGLDRRERILAAATVLFRENGYHATGIDEIGEAAGITGPGIYRHFSSKDAILMTVFDRIWLRLRESISVASELEPQEALVLLVETHVDLVVDNRTATTLLLQELRSLPENYQAKATRNAATYRDAWANAIVKKNPALSLDEGRLMAGSCFWLINAFDGDPIAQSISQDRAKYLLAEMAYAALAVR